MYVCTYIRTHVSVTLRNFNLHNCTHLHSRACSETHASRALTMEVEDREERRFLTMEDTENSAAGPPQLMCFAELSAEHRQQLATLRNRKQRRSQEGKKRTRESAKEKSMLWRVFTSHV